jgi:hypothetical protein
MILTWTKSSENKPPGDSQETTLLEMYIAGDDKVPKRQRMSCLSLNPEPYTITEEPPERGPDVGLIAVTDTGTT